MQREDLNPIEEAEGITRLQDEYQYTQEELSNILENQDHKLAIQSDY